MTEKRFEIREEDIIVEYHELEGLHTCIRNNGEFMTYQELVDLLNEQDKKIQQLFELLAFIHQMKKCNDNCSVEDYINKCFKG